MRTRIWDLSCFSHELPCKNTTPSPTRTMPPTLSCATLTRMNIVSQSKARVPGQTALASLRECVADKKVGGRAKQALKDLTMHR
jgi:hypothetical protein